MRDDGTFTNPGKEAIDYLISKQFPDEQPLKPTDYSTKTVSRDSIEKWEVDWITPVKLQTIFNNFKSKKSANEMERE